MIAVLTILLLPSLIALIILAAIATGNDGPDEIAETHRSVEFVEVFPVHNNVDNR